MTAPPLKGAKATCARKRRHPCEITARAAAMHQLEVNGNIPALSVYQCRICNGWHLTQQQIRNYTVTRKYCEKQNH